jgi:two-component sensor histidine kinase
VHVSTQRTRLLLRELNHRVKNTLAMLQSLARQTLRQTSDPQEFMTAFAGRLQSISEAHGLLSDHEWGDIHLSALLAKQLAPHVRDYGRQIEIHKDEILLGPDQAVGLGLVLHELATNAAKYGSLSVPNGKVVVTARGVDEDGHRVLHMTWSEVGGPPVGEPARRGFGSILIERSLDKVMGSSAKVEYLPAGLTAIIRLPL